MTNHLPASDAAVSNQSRHWMPGESLVENTQQLYRCFLAVLRAWRQRSRDRAALRSLSSQAVHDFCPRQTEADMEMNKPFWRA